MTHRVVNGFGNNGSFARTEMTSVFEIKTHQDVCRSVELQNFAKSLCEFVHNQRSNANFAVVRALHSRIRRLLRIMRSSFFRRHTSQTFFGCTADDPSNDALGASRRLPGRAAPLLFVLDSNLLLRVAERSAENRKFLTCSSIHDRSAVF